MAKPVRKMTHSEVAALVAKANAAFEGVNLRRPPPDHARVVDARGATILDLLEQFEHNAREGLDLSSLRCEILEAADAVKPCDCQRCTNEEE